VVEAVEPMLRRVIGADITIQVELERNPGAIVADEGQLEQVLVNLAVNARDAMQRGGTLRITTGGSRLDTPLTVGESTVPPGDYITLAVHDTGMGMDAETIRRAFQPFFTTKEPGKGTGLGLATVYGIVKQSRGYITLTSDPGVGTTVALYLPRVAGEVPGVEQSPAESMRPAAKLTAQRETIMLVDDEPTLRQLAQRSLEQAGYKVLSAINGVDALEKYAAYDGRIDMVVTDIVMPIMGGREFIEQLSARGSTARVLFMSGYTDDEVMRRGLLEPGTKFLPKPFSLNGFLGKVREVLDEPRQAPTFATDGRAA
jgi:CheY-like chemotaxis protein